MLSRTKLNELKAKVEQEPGNSLARTIYYELEELWEDNHRKERLERMFLLTTEEGMTHEEAKRLSDQLELGNLKGIEYAVQTCRICKGSGTVEHSQCMGFTSKECHRCHGKGTASQIQAPKSTDG